MNLSPFGGFSLVFSIIPIFVMLGFVIVIGIIIACSVQGARQWGKNNDSPILTVDATVVTKRSDMHHSHHNTGPDNMNYTSSSTTYYATFEVASGDRMEFKISDAEYGMLVESDSGALTFQGTRYLGFERSRS